MSALSRRSLLVSGVAGLAASATLRPAVALAATASNSIAPALLRRALAALEQHRSAIAHSDVMGIADFSLPSRTPRFYLLDVASGRVSPHLVAHGRGSDPAHTGWLERFSNEPHSNATSAGPYRTDGDYIGSHGRSIRLSGLDASNSNALSRAIVVHGAWYVSPDMVREHGVLGRSQGCLAVADASLDEVLSRLGPGRLIYADRIELPLSRS